jgi:hypothetical protein
MRVRGNVQPKELTIEPYSPMPGYVEVRLRENVNQITVSGMDDEEITMFEYDEYTFVLAEKDTLQEDIESNFADWLITGRTLEVNENASIVQDMKAALEIMGVNVNE